MEFKREHRFRKLNKAKNWSSEITMKLIKCYQDWQRHKLPVSGLKYKQQKYNREYYQQFYTPKSDNLNAMNHFLEKYKITRTYLIQIR